MTVTRADHDRTDRAGEALRQAEGDGIGRAGEVGRTDALGHDRVPEPGAIDMQGDAVLPGDRGDLGGIGRGERLTHRMGVGVLDGDEPCDRFVRVARVAEGGLDLGRIDGPVRAILEGSHAGADDDRVAGGLVDDHVMLSTGDRLLAAGEVGHLGDEVAHRAAGDEQAGFLAEQVGRAFLQGVDRRVVAEDVITQLGLGHRATHRRRWMGDGVAAQVDPGHEGRV